MNYTKSDWDWLMALGVAERVAEARAVRLGGVRARNAAMLARAYPLLRRHGYMMGAP